MKVPAVLEQPANLTIFLLLQEDSQRNHHNRQKRNGNDTGWYIYSKPPLHTTADEGTSLYVIWVVLCS